MAGANLLNEVFLWQTVDRHGNEGVMTVERTTPEGKTQLYPLVSNDGDLMRGETVTSTVMKSCKQAGRSARLVRFTRGDELKQVEAPPGRA
jgi:hypothetical protein